MNYYYIEYMVQQRINDELEECRRRRLLKQHDGYSLRSHILHSARSSFKRIGFEKTRIADICRELGISRKIFHQHFQSLDEVLEVLWAR